jgi:hypothetical protein
MFREKSEIKAEQHSVNASKIGEKYEKMKRSQQELYEITE